MERGEKLKNQPTDSVPEETTANGKKDNGQ